MKAGLPLAQVSVCEEPECHLVAAAGGPAEALRYSGRDQRSQSERLQCQQHLLQAEARTAAATQHVSCCGCVEVLICKTQVG